MHPRNGKGASKFSIFSRVWGRVKYEKFIALHRLRNLFARVVRFSWRFSRTQISETARIHPSAWISSFKVKIGSDCVLGPRVVVHENSILGDRVHLGAGCIVGSEGFIIQAGIPTVHSGGVHLHGGVRILSRSCVDRSAYGGYTEIGEGSCIDKQVHIAHDVTLGRRCRVGPHTFVAGEVVVGDDVKICNGATISNSLTIGNSVRIGPGAVVTAPVEDKKSVSGNFAIDSGRHREFVRRTAEGDLGWLI